jgi:hypothetical protein
MKARSGNEIQPVDRHPSGVSSVNIYIPGFLRLGLVRHGIIIVDFWSEIDRFTSSPIKCFSLVESMVTSSSAIRYTIHPYDECLFVSLVQQIVQNPEADTIPDTIVPAATARAKFGPWALQRSHIGSIVNGFIGDSKPALALDEEMIHSKTRKLKICITSTDLPLTNILFPFLCPPPLDKQEMSSAVEMIVSCFHQLFRGKLMIINQTGIWN